VLSLPQLVNAAARCRPGQVVGTEAASKLALKSLAMRYQQLAAAIEALDSQIEELARQAAPQLMQVKGVGVDTGGALLAAVGDNPERLHSESAFAHLRGVAPIPASIARLRQPRWAPWVDQVSARTFAHRWPGPTTAPCGSTWFPSPSTSMARTPWC
jgi:transposase